MISRLGIVTDAVNVKVQHAVLPSLPYLLTGTMIFLPGKEVAAVAELQCHQKIPVDLLQFSTYLLRAVVEVEHCLELTILARKQKTDK
jgi:hypothetical protein